MKKLNLAEIVFSFASNDNAELVSAIKDFLENNQSSFPKTDQQWGTILIKAFERSAQMSLANVMRYEINAYLIDCKAESIEVYNRSGLIQYFDETSFIETLPARKPDWDFSDEDCALMQDIENERLGIAIAEYEAKVAATKAIVEDGDDVDQPKWSYPIFR